MRVSTNMIFEQGTSSLNRQQNAFMKVGQQIASNRRVVNASDDPLAMSKATTIGQSKAVNEQFEKGRLSAKNSISQTESVLNSVASGIASAKTLLIQGASGTLSNENREAIASELKGIFETMLGQANAADGNGRYLFGGFKDSSPPYAINGAGEVEFLGDSGIVKQKVDSGRVMDVSVSGESIFNSYSGLGVLSSRAGEANTGTVQISTPSIVDSSHPDFGQPFEIVFSDVAGVAHYSVNGDPPVAYASGDKIEFNGTGIILKGEPQPGDTVEVASGSHGQTNLFKTLKDAIDVLSSPVTTEADQARLSNVLKSTMNELDGSLDNVLTVRASAGAKLNELDVIDTVGANKDLNYTQSISELIDLDMNEALSEYALRQVGLQAAQKTFVDIQKMSLFNYI